jgi:tRNA A-37 threonylcarbamoyl transferase component Bud32
MVDDEWWASPTRSDFEFKWLQLAAEFIPGAVPRVIGRNEQANIILMEYLPEDRYGVWRKELLAFRIDPAVAGTLGSLTGLMHQKTAYREEIAREFASDSVFLQTRIDPYFHTVKARHPIAGGAIDERVADLMERKIALVHGDICPKNVLLGPNGPVIIDAECAWYGDPGFDVGFFLSSLLIKAVVFPQHLREFLDTARKFHEAYMQNVTWEPIRGLEGRIAALAPILVLGRVDGKVPVPFLTAEAGEIVREICVPLICRGVVDLEKIFLEWEMLAIKPKFQSSIMRFVPSHDDTTVTLCR